MTTTREVALERLMEGVPGQRLGTWTGVRVTGLATDSRRVRAGSVFFALPGERAHGARYLADAVARGASAVVTPDPTHVPPGGAVLVHPDPAALLAPLSARLFDRPADHLDLVGVTGTNGKTTTALMVSSALREGGRSVAHWTTTEVRAGDTSFRPYWTTPPPPDLHRFLAEGVAAGADAASLEVSSHGIVLGRIDGLRFRAGAVTNLSPDHIDFHGDFAHYAAAKRRFVTGMEPPATCLINDDDPVVRTFGDGARCRIVRYGTGSGSDLRIHDVRVDAAGVSFRLDIGPDDLRGGGDRTVAITVPMPGRHNAMNAAAAAGMALSMGAAQADVVRALSAFAPPPRRLEARRVGPFTVLNDVAMNEGSYDAVFQAVADQHAGPVVVVHALRGHRGAEGNAAVAGVLARWNARIGFAPLLVSLSRAEVARLAVDHRVRQEEIDAFSARCRQDGLDVDLCEGLSEAIDRAVDRLAPGGLLLLLGTFGMDDGPRMAEEALCRVAGIRPADLPTYLEPSYGTYEAAKRDST